MTGSVYASGSSATSITSIDPGNGLHTLVTGLTVSPSAPATPSAAQPSFSSSIFNNPDRDYTSSPTTTAARASPPSRRFLDAVASPKVGSSAVKEVDDPSTTPSNDRSGTPGRPSAAASPSQTTTYGINTAGRCSSYRGTPPAPTVLPTRNGS